MGRQPYSKDTWPSRVEYRTLRAAFRVSTMRVLVRIKSHSGPTFDQIEPPQRRCLEGHGSLIGSKRRPSSQHHHSYEKKNREIERVGDRLTDTHVRHALVALPDKTAQADKLSHQGSYSKLPIGTSHTQTRTQTLKDNCTQGRILFRKSGRGGKNPTASHLSCMLSITLSLWTASS